MEDLGPAHFDGVGIAVKKKRTRVSRHPKLDTQSDAGSQDLCSLSTSLPSDDACKASSDENADTNPRRKEVNLNQLVNWAGSGVEGVKICARNREDEGFKTFYNNDHGRSAFMSKRSSGGVLAPANWKNSKDENVYGGTNGEIRSSKQFGVILDAQGSDSHVRKVKLKVGGVTRTIETNSTFNMPQSSDTLRSDQKQNIQVNLKKSHLGSHNRSGLQGIPWRDFSGSGFALGKEDSSMVRISGKNTSAKQGDKPGPAPKSKRVAKRHALDGEFGEDYEDDEIRYLEKLRAPKMTTRGYKKEDNELRRKQRNLSSVGKVGTLRFVKDGKKSRLDRSSEDGDYEEEEQLVVDAELEGNQKKKQKESVDSLTDSRRGMTLTTRQRALQSSKDGSLVFGAHSIEFPNGLPPAPSRKQKEKLSEVEQQIKKAEAAERRRLQNERAARESEAEAIRKILGQDSSRKKREDKIKKRREELAQKAANALLGSNSVRWVMGPTGTVVTFPKDMGLPSIFDSKPTSYPPPREKCAGPSCSNPYRYRDSKSKLPLCSLQCYKAVQEQTQAETGC